MQTRQSSLVGSWGEGSLTILKYERCVVVYWIFSGVMIAERDVGVVGGLKLETSRVIKGNRDFWS